MTTLTIPKPCLPPTVEVSWGSENLFANGLRNLFALPFKLLYWNERLAFGNISEKTVQKVTHFLKEKGLTDVEVCVNEYDPVKYASRIFSNPLTSRLSKGTLGVISALLYTFIPTKLFYPFDFYSPFSNSIHLVSDDPHLALLEGAKADYYHKQENPSLHFISTALPYIKNYFYFFFIRS